MCINISDIMDEWLINGDAADVNVHYTSIGSLCAALNSSPDDAIVVNNIALGTPPFPLLHRPIHTNK